MKKILTHAIVSGKDLFLYAFLFCCVFLENKDIIA